MQVPLTKREYVALLRLVYLADWMANSHRVPGREKMAFAGIVQHIYAQAEAFDCGDLVEYIEELGEYEPTRELEDDAEVRRVIDSYDDDTFWHEIFHRLSERDFERAYSEKEVKAMSEREFFAAEEPFRRKWDSELDAHGVERLEVVENPRKQENGT